MQDIHPLLPASHCYQGGCGFQYPVRAQHRLPIESHAGHSQGDYGGQIPGIYQRLYAGHVRGSGGAPLDSGCAEVSECGFSRELKNQSETTGDFISHKLIRVIAVLVVGVHPVLLHQAAVTAQLLQLLLFLDVLFLLLLLRPNLHLLVFPLQRIALFPLSFEVRTRLYFGPVQPVNDVVEPLLHPHLAHFLPAMERHLTHVHSGGLLQVVPHRVDNVDVVHLVAHDAVRFDQLARVVQNTRWDVVYGLALKLAWD